MAPPAAGRWSRHAPALAVAAIVGGTALGGLGTRRYTTLPAAAVVRTIIDAPGAAALSVNTADRDLAITPDRSHVIWRAADALAGARP